MKKLVTLLVLLSCNLGIRAQLIIFSEKFDEMTSYTITGWGYEYTGAVPWECGLPNQVGGCMPPPGGPMSVETGTNKVAAIADCGAMWNPNDSNVFTYTPIIDLSTVTGSWLRYDSYFGQFYSGADTERATVEISTDSGATWSVIQNVPPNAPYGVFQTWYIDLSAYDHMSHIQIGFRYKDEGGWLKGWAIDNVEVFVPAHNDIALLSVTPSDTMLSYVALNQAYLHHATVYNAGLDTIHSFTLSYRQDAGTITSYPVTGVNIPGFATADIIDYAIDSVLSAGTHKVTIWATLAGDTGHDNDTAISYLRGVNFMPAKKLAIESGEGTYNGWSPRNMYYLSTLASLDVEACIASIHEDDPMLDTPYHDFIFNFGWNYIPYMLFDRRVSVPFDSFYTYVNVEKKYFGFADIALDGGIDGTTVTVNASVTPAMDLLDGYNLALVITQDGVQGTGSGYNQVNNYAGGVRGPMGGYESMPATIPAGDMTYNYVARTISPSPTGESLSPVMLSGNTYLHTLTSTIDPSWGTNRLKAIVFLIRNSDSTILNSNELPFYLDVPTNRLAFDNAVVYPNPANDYAKIAFNLLEEEPVNISVTDLTGRVIIDRPATLFPTGKNVVTLSLKGVSQGIYLINLSTNDGHKTLKLEVLK